MRFLYRQDCDTPVLKDLVQSIPLLARTSSGWGATASSHVETCNFKPSLRYPCSNSRSAFTLPASRSEVSSAYLIRNLGAAVFGGAIVSRLEGPRSEPASRAPEALYSVADCAVRR